jgi:PhnB protein
VPHASKQFVTSRIAVVSIPTILLTTILGTIPTSLSRVEDLCSHGLFREGRRARRTPTLNLSEGEDHMSNKVSPVPEGYHSVTPYLIVKGAAQAINYYKDVFGAKEVFRMDQPDGKVGHAELQIGDSRIMLADENPNMGAGHASAGSIGGTPVSLYLYIPDVDRVVERAVAAGAKILKPVQDQFYGDRSGFIQDPFGHLWGVATHVEDVSPQEMEERAKKAQQAA